MQSNIPKQPTLGNQPNTTDQDYAIGDVVVLINGDDDSLYEFSRINIVLNAKCYITKPRKAKMLCVWIGDIHPATTAELKAKRRLSETEQSLAEVS